MTTVNTPKPTPREALSHLCWALAHVENADEDLRVLSAALESTETLRAEVAALKAKMEEAEATNDRLRQDRLDYSAATTTEGMNASEWIWRTGKAERERDTAKSRATALAARVEALEAEKSMRLWQPLGDNHHNAALCPYCQPNLAAHDDRIRREMARSLRPTAWTRPMSEAWHRAIPDVHKAFDDLFRAAGIKETK